MNWYRFKVELVAWIVKTGIAVLTVLSLGSALFRPADSVRYYPLSMRWLAANEWIMSLGFAVAMGLLWLCYWKAIRVYRGRRAYEAR